MNRKFFTPILLLMLTTQLGACAQPGSLRAKEQVNERELTMYVYPKEQNQQGQKVHIKL